MVKRVTKDKRKKVNRLSKQELKEFVERLAQEGQQSSQVYMAAIKQLG